MHRRFEYCLQLLQLYAAHNLLCERAKRGVAVSGRGSILYRGWRGAPFQLTASQCYCYGIYIPSGGAVTLKHCDFWGFAEGIVLGSGYAGPFVMDNCWVHDCQNAGQGAHQDGIGYLNGAAAPTNVTITNNTIAMIGNTNCIALQSASTTWNNYTINNNYLSGDELIVQAFSSIATNCSFTNNIFGTNLPYGGYLIYPLSANQPVMPSVIFSNTSGNSGNTWSGTTSSTSYPARRRLLAPRHNGPAASRNIMSGRIIRFMRRIGCNYMSLISAVRIGTYALHDQGKSGINADVFIEL